MIVPVCLLSKGLYTHANEWSLTYKVLLCALLYTDNEIKDTY